MKMTNKEFKVSFGDDDRILKLDYCHGCTTLNIVKTI